MTMSKYFPIVFGAHDRKIYGFLRFYNGHAPLITKLDRTIRELSATSGRTWLAATDNGCGIVGFVDFVGNMLGWEHELAKDRHGRPLECFLGVTADRTACLPRDIDLHVFAEQMNGEWKRTLVDTNLWAQPPEGSPVEITGFAEPETQSLWNKVVLAHREGSSSGVCVLHPDGSMREVVETSVLAREPQRATPQRRGLQPERVAVLAAGGVAAVHGSIAAAQAVERDPSTGEARRNWRRTVLHSAEAAAGFGAIAVTFLTRLR